MKNILAMLLLLTSINAFAKIGAYEDAKILARANLFDSYNLPEFSFLNNTDPIINNRGDIAFKVLSSEGKTSQGIWIKRYDDEAGKILYLAPEDLIISDPFMTEEGMLTFSISELGTPQGVYTYDLNTDTLNHFLVPENDSIVYFTYPMVNNRGEVMFRGTDQNNTRAFYLFDGKLETITSEGDSIFAQSTSYLFKQFMNDDGSFVFKRRVGGLGEFPESNPDEVVLMKPNGSGFDSVVIAQDVDADKKSSFKSFSNTLSMNDKNEVAFVADLVSGGKALVVAKDGKFKTLVKEKENDIKEIESFEVKINNNGLVAFRAKDSRGKRSIFIADEEGMKKLISEGDEIPTDKGLGKILANPQYPGFGGNIDLNDQGEIVFFCLVIDAKASVEWGSAVYKFSPKK